MPLPLAGKRLLLAVEDPVLAELLAEASARLGAEASVAATGRDALEALAAPDRPPAAVLDLPMADVRGLDLTLVTSARPLRLQLVTETFGLPVFSEDGQPAHRPRPAGSIPALRSDLTFVARSFAF